MNGTEAQTAVVGQFDIDAGRMFVTLAEPALPRRGQAPGVAAT
jgi:hypothetical protein